MTVHPDLSERTCYHKYEVEPGLFTPGKFAELDPKICLDEIGVASDLSGVRALDIGAWDGPFTFELERRGAQVTAMDIQDPDVTVFNAVKKIKNSSATYVRSSVYDAVRESLGIFDLVLFAGVYYHLKNPVLALQRIRRLLADQGILFIEGSSTTDYLAARLRQELNLPRSKIDALANVVDRLPVSYFDIEQELGGWSNWWYPTTGCLEAVLLDSGFRNVSCELKPSAFNNYLYRRLMGRAEADPGNPQPDEQTREHEVLTEEYTSTNLSAARRLIARLPPGLKQETKRVRRTIRKTRRTYRQIPVELP
ncbi:MAG: methyltransferase domain-containing protein [Acidobacteriaceae bacterium]|nr:methyltransferase domain-containing protein [Acidobacteriaceae bacterium]